MAFSPRITADEFTDFEDEFQDVGEPTPQKKLLQPTQKLSFDNEFTDLSDEFEDIDDQSPIVKQPLSQENTPEKRPYSTPYDAPDISLEQLKNMSVSERLQYARDLKTEREYRQSKGFTKGLLSGASFGLSEKIPGLAPEEGDFLVGFGEFIGSAIPISKLYNLLGKPLVSLAAKSPIAKKGLEAFARMTGFGLTGAAYEGAKETIKTGETPTPQELLKYGAQWAAFDGALQALGKTASFLNGLRNYSNAKQIPEKTALEGIFDTLSKENINPEKNPEAAINRAEEIIGSLQQPKEGVQPITETTGSGAAERVEYAPTGMERIIKKADEFIEAAKTPAESLKRLGERSNEAIFNALAPLERIETEIPLTERPSTHIRLAQSAASEINSVLENGIFSNITGNFEHHGLKGAYGDLTWKKLSKGLKEGEYSLQDLDTYRVSKATLKRQAEGKKTGVDTQQAIKDINRLQKKYEPIDENIRNFQKATLNHYGKDLLGKDLIAVWNKDYYAPLYRIMEEGNNSVLKSGSLLPKQPFKKMKGSERKIIAPSESDPLNASMLIRNAKKNEAVLQYRNMVEQGKLPGRLLESKNEPIPPAVLESMDVDPNLNPIVEQLYNQTRKEAFTPQKNRLRGWKNGKPFEIEVPDEIYNVFSSLVPEQRGFVPKVMSAMNRLFSKGITMEPRKFASIVSRDALSSLIYSKTGSNPISITEALGDIYNGAPVYKEFLAMGGDVYASRLAERIDRARKIEELITPGKDGILVPFEKMGDFFRKYSKTLGDISLSVPLAEYKRALDVYGNTAEGRIMAAIEARRVTYDPTRKGSSAAVRELGNFIPFWNVSLQDIPMLVRNLKSPEAWVKGFTAITLPTLLLKSINEGNPDYQDLTPVDKAAFWHLYFGDKHVRIPIPWLLGTAFKVGAESFYDITKSMSANGDDRSKEAWEGLYHNFVENLSGDLPPLLQNYVELTTGKSAPSPLGLLLGTESRAPEVVPRRLQDLPESMQYTSRTSQLARWFGEHWGVSPVKLDRVISTFGGLVAKDALALIDEAAYWSGLAEDKRPEQRESNYLLLGNFVSNSTPSRTKYAEEFYDMLREATKNKNAQRIINEKGLSDKSLESMEFNGVHLFAYNRAISKLFKELRSIEDSDMKPAEKKRQMDELQREINDLYKQAVEGARQ